ncbi:ionotropic receptor 93a isoform X4 [Venturia canescens]|uniref:ionotropic receptor 93a isoform X4 n=1 Tax=Venturia canescens TaxID=32260 RepID=UPI001C9C4B11|nr:ionotropic receptor 93a isoform X4 [Venturia canescens]
MYFIFFLALVNIKFSTGFNDFPSLMIANATMAVVIERPFFEVKAVKKRHTVRNAYEKKLEALVRTITEAAKARDSDSNVGMEINVFQETSVNLARDYTVLLSVASCHETWSLFQRARKEKLVHLAITDHDCPRLPSAYGISVPIVEPSQELPQMLLDLRVGRVISWTKINVLHDHIFERDTIGSVFRALFGEIPNVPHLGLSSQCFFSTGSSNHSMSMKKHRIMETLQKFPRERFSGDRFLVIVSTDIVTLIIESARTLGLLHPESQWLFVLSDSAENPSNVTELQKLLAEGENIAFICNVTNFDEDCKVGLECHAKEMVTSLIAGLTSARRQEVELYEKITDEEFDAVRMTKAERCEQLVSFVRDDLYKPDGEKERKRKCDDCLTWKMLAGITWGNSFHRKNKSEAHQLIDAGFWTPGQGSAPKELLFPHSEYGFRNKALPIVTYHNPPWQFISKSLETGQLKWDGLVFDIVNELSKKLNFTCKLVESGTRTIESEEHAKKLKNRTETGAKNEEFIRTLTSSGERIPNDIADLVRSGQVFMAACASTITENLKSSFNFTAPIAVQTYGLLAPRPKPLSRVMLFASPYTIESWACLAGAVVSVGSILYLVHEYSPSNLNGPQSIQFGLSTPAKCLWYIYGALLQQGGLRIPENDGARLIVGTWWLVVMVVVATYSGSLVAFLTFPRMDESISTLDDIFKRKESLTWSLPAKSYLVEYLTSGKSGPYDGLLGDDAHQPERHDASNYETMINRVKDGTHVLVDWTSSLRMLTRIDNPLTNDGVCHFSIGTETFVEESIALLLPLGSPYLPLVNTQLKRMKESGLIDKWIKDRMPMKDECWEGSSLNNQVNNHKVDVWDMQGIFFVLFLGYLISLLFLGWELLSRCRQVAKERTIIRPFLS